MNGDMPRMVFRVEALQEEGDLTQAREVRLPKRTIPKRDVRALLLELLRKGEMPSIVLVVGETAIVDKDVEALLQGARGRYRMDQKRVNLLDPWGVAKVLKDLGQSEYHLVALVRGGGEGLEALDSPEVWEAVATCPKPVVVALGHAANTLWVETLADEAFPTPSAFGSFLGEVVKMVEREMREAKEKATLADLLHKAQDENRALRQEADRLKEQLRKLEGEPGVLFQEVARLRQALGVWRAVALGALQDFTHISVSW
ncbi:exonuclease VII large subunit [Thermus scotoductus]|uniref:Exonuclease VII large subunit n=2 Tax=Thermus scotoductus TaxID=37636 RepID=A0A430R7H6_THESC|nr:exonuclease VII large subunit [Thermus scotoductus]RTH03380.1 exonuclease VII large subunit [Thermus scotoductus]RTH18971.1 exonuclease VII large subunit [Thermus scotoductus]RTH99783.1 exonuclease VII large subunit [Thermus scotoductus]RTI21023.1 exonuclease VII large subunit [Thermus scotoductus]